MSVFAVECVRINWYTNVTQGVGVAVGMSVVVGVGVVESVGTGTGVGVINEEDIGIAPIPPMCTGFGKANFG